MHQQQEEQQRRVPAFEFTDLVPSDNPHHSTLQNKLKLSAKNRNALRRVKRKVLRKYGGQRTFRKSHGPDGGSGESDGKGGGGGSAGNGGMGAFYTRKNTSDKRGGGGGGLEALASGSEIAPPATEVLSWSPKDSLGDPLKDSSSSDLNLMEGTTPISLDLVGGGLETVEV